MKTAIIFGGSGGLATELINHFSKNGVLIDVVTRKGRTIDNTFIRNIYTVEAEYSEFIPRTNYDIVLFAQALFGPKPIVDISEDTIIKDINVGLLHQIILTHRFLKILDTKIDKKIDFCYIGSVAAYNGIRNTVTYCTVKHGLLGFVRSLNDEYSASNIRFWLFSMAGMKTDMGSKIVGGGNPDTFLEPKEVATRIAQAINSDSMMFEPEMLIRRRKIN